MLIDDLADAPNPQFARPRRTDLNGTWCFAFDDDDRGVHERWFASPERLERKIEVPFPPESPLSGIGDRSFHPVSWYARQFRDARSNDTARILLNFGAVDYHADIWVDGQHVGDHAGGHTPFAFDIAPALDPESKEHWIVVRAFDDPFDAEQPRGKQDWQAEPHVIWYHRTSGIWQSVWLEEVPRLSMLSVRWRFDRARWLVDYEVELSHPAPVGSELRIELAKDDEPLSTTSVSISDRTMAGQVHIGAGRRTMSTGDLLWSPRTPNLITAMLTLSSPGRVADVVHSYMGLRTIETSGRNLLLNGSPLFLRFVLQQGYWPESQLAAPSPDHLRREVELIQELGFNGARIHQKVEDPRFLYWADRLGLLLWGEIANAFTFSERAIERHAGEWREAVLRDRNHPSIIGWVPFNESWGVSELGSSDAQRRAVTAAYHKTHQLDGTRPVVGNDGWENVAGDLLTIHDYSWDPDVLARRYRDEEAFGATLGSYFPGSRHLTVGDFDPVNKPVLVTEFGGVSFAPDAGESWFGYGTVRSPEEYVERYRMLNGALQESSLLSGFCYTQLTDTEQETNGLLTAARGHKVPVESIRAITSGASATSGEPE